MNRGKIERDASREFDRVKCLVEGAIDEIKQNGGDVLMFSAFLTRAACEMHVTVFGDESLNTTISNALSATQIAARGGFKC